MKDYEEYSSPSFFSDPIGCVKQKLKSLTADIEVEEEEYEDEEPEVDGYHEEPKDYRRSEKTERPLAEKKRKDNVISFNRENLPQKSVEITDPANLEDASRVADFLLQNIIVTVNLEKIDKQNAQRVADFLCGAAYASSSTISRISNHIFIITPSGTGVSGGRKEEDGGYDLPKVASYR